MEIHFKDLAEGHNDLCFQETQESLSLKPQDLFLMKPVEVSLTVIKTKEKLAFYGKMEAWAEPECARCLKLFAITLKAEVKFILDQSEAASRAEFQDDDYQSVSKAVATYNLTQRLREALLLSLPMRFLCSPDCQGLCPKCGANLNIEKCGCKKEEIDPRWGKLEQMLKE
ncbi:MAG: hypothetical protein A2142_04865 [candidate division Zixibacteria bacterium RBG_16_48_11]|nr:MAG: hypothetical protein A2142_04865 [candidate division Zixibacteria bacterium RBG_16_48_11]